MKKTNPRCPLQSECEKTCKHQGKEYNCDYYSANTRPGFEIEGLVIPPAEIIETNAPPKTGNLVYISIDKLFPHPHNPRKDLGDLIELSESIKARGVMQNLTVVPQNDGRCGTCENYIGGTGNCRIGYQNELSKAIHLPSNEGKFVSCEKHEGNGRYTVVIGHRRMAAAKLAGLTELPCAIVDMNERDQVATMLLENMQRADLTVIEQADGMQMMLDLGETITGISEKTGFSESNVRHRVKLNELDRKKFTEAVQRGGTIQDYIALEKIVDKKVRNQVLEKIGTSDFNWQLSRVLKEQEYPALRAKVLELLDGWAKPTKDSAYSNGMSHVHSFYNYQIENFKKPKDAEKAKYVYIDGGSSLTLYKKDPKEAPHKKTEAEKSYAEREAQMKELAKRSYELRYDFVKNFTSGKRYAASIHAFAMRKLMGYGGAGIEDMLKILDLQKPEDRPGDDYYAKQNRVREKIMEVYGDHPEKVMLMAAYLGYHDGPSSAFYNAYNWECRIGPRQNEDLSTIYDALIEIGYELSEEEQQLRDGTHELFDKPKAKGEQAPAEPCEDEEDDDAE